MKQANITGLIDAVLAETIPMHGRMIHGQKQGKLFEESQAYDIHGRVSLLVFAQVKARIDECSSLEQSIELDSTNVS